MKNIIAAIAISILIPTMAHSNNIQNPVKYDNTDDFKICIKISEMAALFMGDYLEGDGGSLIAAEIALNANAYDNVGREELESVRDLGLDSINNDQKNKKVNDFKKEIFENCMSEK